MFFYIYILLKEGVYRLVLRKVRIHTLSTDYFLQRLLWKLLYQF